MDFLTHLKNGHPLIKFTMEKELNAQLAFLDVLVTPTEMVYQGTQCIGNRRIPTVAGKRLYTQQETKNPSSI